MPFNALFAVTISGIRTRPLRSTRRNVMEPKFIKTTLDVSSITIDEAFDFRSTDRVLKSDRSKTRAPSVSIAHLGALRKNLRTKKTLDPIIVWDEVTGDGCKTERLLLLDGRYRLAAYEAERRKQIPARIFNGNRMEAQLVALCANSRDTMSLSNVERMNAAWKLVWEHGDQLAKPRISEASGVSVRTVLTMRNKRKEMKAAGAVGGLDWRQDKSWPKTGEWTPPTPDERQATIEAVADTIRQAVHEHRLGNRMEDLTEALELGLGRKGLTAITDYYLDPEEAEDEAAWMVPVEDLSQPIKETIEETKAGF